MSTRQPTLFDLAGGDCPTCGRPLRRHHAGTHKIPCAKLAVIDALALGDTVHYWSRQPGARPVKEVCVIVAFSPDRLFARVRRLGASVPVHTVDTSRLEK